MKKTTRLKKLVLDPEILVLPGIHDALSARIIEKAGFQGAIVGGYPSTAALLGQPDMSFLTLTEMVDHFARLADATDLALLVDGDTGHGGVLNVQRTVREIERSGAAAMFIEDQVFPKRCGHMEGKEVIPADEMVAKLKAALDARSDPDFMLMARTDALAVNGLDDAIERAQLYRETGADIIFVEAPRTVAEMRRITGEIKAPTFANNVEGGKTPLLPAAELQEIGYAIVGFPVAATYAAAQAVTKLMEILKETGNTTGYHDRMWMFDQFSQFMDVPGVRRKEKSFYE